MPTVEEKIKLFFSDTAKVEALIKDTEFMDKVSNGTADTETYKSEFKKLGLELSEDDLEKVKTVVDKIINTPAKELEDISLENISGGLSYDAQDNLAISGFVIGGAGAISGLGCGIASIIHYSKANKAMKSGKVSESKRLSKIAKNLAIAAGACGAVAVPGLVTAAIMEFGPESSEGKGDQSLFEDVVTLGPSSTL